MSTDIEDRVTRKVAECQVLEHESTVFYDKTIVLPWREVGALLSLIHDLREQADERRRFIEECSVLVGDDRTIKETLREAASLRAERHALRVDYDRLREQVEHQEGGIGDTEIRALVAERDALRNVVLNYLDDHARLVTNEALRERKRLLLPDELVPCACDICGYAERALSSPERSLSTAAHKSSSSTAAKGGETDG